MNFHFLVLKKITVMKETMTFIMMFSLYKLNQLCTKFTLTTTFFVSTGLSWVEPP